MAQLQPGQTGLPSVSGQRRRRNTSTMSPSDIRMILAAMSERAAADSRKCWAMPTAAEHPTSFLPEARPRYKPDFAGGGCYMMPEFSAVGSARNTRQLRRALGTDD